MRIGFTVEDEKGLESRVSGHLGQCGFFCIVEIEDDKVKEVQTVTNSTEHGGGGCQAVSELMKHNIQYVVSGGMGGGAQMKFQEAGIQVFGHDGTVQSAVDVFIRKQQLGQLEACPGHGEDHHCH